jgi:hypothetical protein
MEKKFQKNLQQSNCKKQALMESQLQGTEVKKMCHITEAVIVIKTFSLMNPIELLN